MKFKEFRLYISNIDRVSICIKETLEYANYQFINQVPDSYNEYYLYGVGRIKSEFPLKEVFEERRALDDGGNPEEMVYAECIEIMLSKEPREFD